MTVGARQEQQHPRDLDPVAIAGELVREVDGLRFPAPVTHVYNPLRYAWEPHAIYLHRFAQAPREVLFLGMNPGPWGMAQTGVPFGDVSMVRDWIGIEAPVERPPDEHPKRPITGFACTRGEVSGRRFWGWARMRFGTPEAFFARCYVHNYCPLVFMEASGRNFTPDRLPAASVAPLFAACDRALQRLCAHLQPRHLVGIGHFAEKCLRRALPDHDAAIARIPHPSPASPAANRNWAEAAEAALRAADVC